MSTNIIVSNDFRVIRRRCAEKYCPKDWSTDLWADFYGDCITLAVENKQDDAEWMDSLYKCWDVPKELVENVVTFIKENIDAFKKI